MQIINDPKLDFKDVLIVPKVSYIASRAEVDITRSFQYVGTNGELNYITGVPIIASNMDGVGTFSMGESLASQGCFTAICKHHDLDSWVANLTKLKYENPHFSPITSNLIMSAGMGAWKSRGDELTRIRDFFTIYPEVKMLCLDVANGYNMEFVDWIGRVREVVQPDTFIIAGNVVTPSQAEALILAGANAVKIGIGSGSVCTTRKVTGVGYPQLSAIIECADAVHGLHGFAVADGGCQTPGDVCKAFAAGADFVMLGGMLAGHEESEAVQTTQQLTGIEITTPLPAVMKYDEVKTVEFHGSSSKTASELHGNGLMNYRSSEGKSVTIPYRGKVENTINHILGGLRSCCTYVGASKLKDLSKRTTFVRVVNGYQYNTVFGDSNEVT